MCPVFEWLVCAAGMVPGSAVLFFQLELVELQKGVPNGFMFVWLGDVPEPLFSAMDLDADGQVPLREVNPRPFVVAHLRSWGNFPVLWF